MLRYPSIILQQGGATVINYDIVVIILRHCAGNGDNLKNNSSNSFFGEGAAIKASRILQENMTRKYFYIILIFLVLISIIFLMREPLRREFFGRYRECLQYSRNEYGIPLLVSEKFKGGEVSYSRSVTKNYLPGYFD